MREAISRRTLFLTSAAAAAFPLLMRDAQAAVDTVEWHDLPQADHIANRDKAYAKGYRELSLSMHGEPSAPRYTAVMFKSQIPTTPIYAPSWSELQKKYVDFAKATPLLAPYIVCGTGPQASATFTAVFAPSALPTFLFGELTRDEFFDTEKALGKLTLARKKNLIPIAFDAYGTPDDTRFCTIMALNGDSSLWSLDAIDEEVATVQQRFNAAASVGGHSSLLAITPAGRYVHGFTDGLVGAWEAHGDMTTASYEAKLNAVKPNAPTRVSSKIVGGAVRYAAIFSSRLDKEPRVENIEAPLGSPPVAAIDTAVLDYMKLHAIRGASLALTAGTRLVYARGYTWAETSYPKTKPHTLFRLASCSKTFAAVAAWKLMQDDPSFTLDTKVQDVLKISPLSGKPGTFFFDITVRHLLESTSGVKPGIVFNSIDAAQAAGHPLPATADDLARYWASFNCDFTPGDGTKVTYSNTGYVLLGQVIAKKAGVATFAQAVKKLIGDPLKMSVRGSTALFNQQQGNEARYDFLGANLNTRASGTPLVPHQYGGMDVENYGGAGGLSASAIDVARLMAMFSAAKDTPVLKVATMQTMMLSAVKATKFLSGPDAHGYHGFDNAVIDPQTGLTIASKGGAFSGTATYLLFAPGGLGVTLLVNRSENPGLKGGEWVVPVIKAAIEHDWGNTDLFAPQLLDPGVPLKQFKLPPAQALPGALFELQRKAFPSTAPALRRRQAR